MEAAYFGFALFIFALLCAFLLIARQIYRSVKPSDRFEREVNWQKRYQDLENMVDGLEAYVDEVQEELRQEKAEMRRIAARVEDTYRKLSGGEDIDAPVIVTLGAGKGYSGYTRRMRPPAEERALPEEEQIMAAQALQTQPENIPDMPRSEIQPPPQAMQPDIVQVQPVEEMIQEEQSTEIIAEAVEETTEERAPERPVITFDEEEAEEVIVEPEKTPPKRRTQSRGARARARALAEEEERRALEEEQKAPPVQQEAAEAQSRNEEVIWMHRMGFSDINIAQQMAITRSEVKMIIELWEKSQEA